ncbi:hypothetical protein GCM10008961_29330 [Deinococcus knuensis]|uniref:Uncharacterized protein n=1 Tax=Deinococcus knuensis TaxID=1837380 RepID=A0ABQ2SP92_9DEIO|nr:hypothetical protein GCM10008961_29330 [Deinococcus knuensis]
MLEEGGALEEFGAVAAGGEEEVAFVVRAGLLVEIQDVHGGQYFILGSRGGWGAGRLGGWVPLRGGGVGA